jgi:hypothetical protein
MSARALARAWTDYTYTQIAEEWTMRLRAALAAEPPVVARVAAHLSAGRVGLAQRMLKSDVPGATRPVAAWDALRAFIAWRAGEGDVPSQDALRHMALHFPSLRRSGLMESISSSTPLATGAVA